MKKSLLLLLVLLFSMNLFGSTYRIHNSGPIGICSSWKTDGLPGQPLADYKRQIDSASSLGFNWTRLNAFSGYWHPIQNYDGIINRDSLDMLDNAIIKLIDNEMYPNFFFTHHPRLRESYDTSYNHGLYYDPHSFDELDSARIYNYFYVLAEIYDGDDSGAFDQLNEEFYKERSHPVTGEPLVITYWEIANEPAWHTTYWGGPKLDTVFDGTIIKSITPSDTATIEDLCKYLKIASDAIHDANPNAKVLGPSVNPLPQGWCLWPRINDPIYLPDEIITIEPDSFWMLLHSDTVLECFDIITLHHGDDRYVFDTLDIMYDIWDSLGFSDSLMNKPIWLTEYNFDRFYIDPTMSDTSGYHEPERSRMFREFYDNFFAQNNVEKAFNYVFHQNAGLYQGCVLWRGSLLEPDDWAHSQSSDTLQALIYRNTPYINITNPDSEDVLISGTTCLINYNSLEDSENHYETPPYELKFWVDISYDGGNNYQLLIDSFNRSYYSAENQSVYTLDTFNVPYINSSNCKIKVYVKDPDGFAGVSTSKFSIKPSYWYCVASPYFLDWNASYQIGTFDECDYIIEKSDGDYLLSVKINQDSTGLVTYNPEEHTFNNEVIFSKTTFSWIHCILEDFNPNLYIIAGKYIDLLGNVKRRIKILNNKYSTICSSTPGLGEFYRVIKDISDEGYITVGWEVVNGVDRIKIQRFVFDYEEERLMRWDTNFATSFNNSQLPGRFYSVIKTEDNNYVAAGYKGRDNGGACCFKFDSSGVLIDSVSFGYISDKWTCFYDVKEDTSYPGYIMVGTCQDYSGAIIVKTDSQCDSLWGNIYDSIFFNDSLNINRLYSIFINQDSTIITSGYGIDPVTNKITGLILQINSENGETQNITAPLSNLYYADSVNTWNSSIVRPMYPTQDGGFIVGCYICDNSVSPWLKKIAISKFSYGGGSESSQGSSASPFELNSYSVLCANSLFRDKSTIRFVLPRQCNVNIVVYNILGQRVRTLVNEEREPGAYEIFWDGTDQRGVSVSSGSYFLRFQAGDFLTTKSLTVIR